MTDIELQPQAPIVEFQVRLELMQAQVVGVAGTVASTVGLQTIHMYIFPMVNMIDEGLLHLHIPTVELHTKVALKQLQRLVSSLDKA
jgi:hypothetical protein